MTIRTFLDATTAKYPTSTALCYRRDNEWKKRTYADFEKGIRQIAEIYSKLGLVPQSAPVALMLENGPEWMEAYLAAVCCGIVVIPIDPKLRSAEIAHVLNDSGATLVLTERTRLDMLEATLPSTPKVQCVVLADTAETRSLLAGRKCHGYEALRAQTLSSTPMFFERTRPSTDDVASIIYTSGTTGKPKGAMLSHGNFCHDAVGALAAFNNELYHDDQFLIVLPLFHSFSFTTNLIVPLYLGAQMSFVESLRTVTDDLKELQPTILMAVPLLAEKMYAKIQAKLEKSVVAKLMLRSGLGKVIGRQVLKSLGGKLRTLVVGGAPCPVEVLKAFTRLGVPIIEGYGLTECSPVVSLTTRKDVRIGTIGRPLPCIEVRLADQNEAGVGELQVRGPIVMKGYYNNPEATAEAFEGDWFRTGDLAIADKDGYLSICGRKKALIVNREGKNIYPEEVENAIVGAPCVADVVVIGYRVGKDPGEHVGCIVTPNMDTILAENGGVEPEWDDIVAHVRKAIAERCETLAKYKHPRKIAVQRDPLERTSIQKVRRVAYQGTLNE